MVASLPSSRLIEFLVRLAGEERGVQASFLVHLDEFDRRRGYLEAGHDSLWNWCVRVLHLSEGAAGRRIAAMRIIRRFPQLLAALRDGRLSLSTIALLGQVLTPENVDDLVARAAYKSRADVDHLVATIRPRHRPRDGIRRIMTAGRPSPVSATIVAAGSSMAEPRSVGAASGPPARTPDCPVTGYDRPAAPPPSSGAPNARPSVAPEVPADTGALRLERETAQVGPGAVESASVPESSRSRADLRPISRDEWSVRVTIDAQCREELEFLRQLLSHKCGGDLAAVLREAIRCAIEKHGKRRGAIRPSRERARGQEHRANDAPPQPEPGVDSPDAGTASVRPGTVSRQPERDAIPAAVRQAVYDRDGGSCSYVSPDGRRCGSKWKLEFDHVLPAFLGGPSTVDNVRLRCRAHNVHHAEQVFGMEHMERFRRRYAVEGYG